MNRIDDPYDAAKSQNPEPSENIPGELALNIAGRIFPVIDIVNTVRGYYSQASVEKRLRVLIYAANLKTNGVDVKLMPRNSPRRSGWPLRKRGAQLTPKR